MQAKAVTLLHPGNMGATIGAAAARGGARVLWVSEQRSKGTRERAQQAGLVAVKTLAEALRASDAVLSVCPPHAAVDVARRVADLKFTGLYVDANAISRATAQEVETIVARAGAGFVDGGIIGSPVKRAGTTRLYLSGARAAEAAQLFSGSMLDARVVGDKAGQASALKMAYAAWTKCSDGLVLAVRALAAAEGVGEALLEEWRLSQPELERRSTRAAAIAAPKAWRYVGEMQEIAASFGAAGLPTGFHEGAADLYERLAPFKGHAGPEVSEVLDVLGTSSRKHRKAI